MLAEQAAPSPALKPVIVVFNAGSTSLKFAAYLLTCAPEPASALSLLWTGHIDSMQGGPHFFVKNAVDKPLDAHAWDDGHAIDHTEALQYVITWLKANLFGIKIIAAGHRVVLGGMRFDAPALIDSDVLDYLESLVAMEPSHQPFNVAGVRAFGKAFPSLPQVACFDNSFHRTMPAVT